MSLFNILEGVDYKITNAIIDTTITQATTVIDAVEFKDDTQYTCYMEPCYLDCQWDSTYSINADPGDYNVWFVEDGVIRVKNLGGGKMAIETFEQYFDDYRHDSIRVIIVEGGGPEYTPILTFGKKLKMWTKGNKLLCADEETGRYLESGTKVYFTSRSQDEPLVRVVEREFDGLPVVDIPDALLTKEENIKVQIDEDDYYQTFEVIRQNKPADYDEVLGNKKLNKIEFYAPCNPETPLYADLKYWVRHNGELYIREAKKEETFGSIYLGNMSLGNLRFENTGEDFLIEYFDGSTPVVRNNDDAEWGLYFEFNVDPEEVDLLIAGSNETLYCAYVDYDTLKNKLLNMEDVNAILLTTFSDEYGFYYDMMNSIASSLRVYDDGEHVEVLFPDVGVSIRPGTVSGSVIEPV